MASNTIRGFICKCPPVGVLAASGLPGSGLGEDPSGADWTLSFAQTLASRSTYRGI